MEKVELNIEMDNNLVAKIHDLARRYFGDDSEESMANVLELAFRMRSLWGHSIRVGQQETNETISNWEFPESIEKRDNSNIQN